VYDTQLNFGLREDGIYGVRETSEAVYSYDENILDATVLEFGKNPKPELGAFILLRPQP
jgi:hypothetical protein